MVGRASFNLFFLRDLRVLRGIPFVLIRKNYSIIRIAVVTKVLLAPL